MQRYLLMAHMFGAHWQQIGKPFADFYSACEHRAFLLAYHEHVAIVVQSSVTTWHDTGVWAR